MQFTTVRDGGTTHAARVLDGDRVELLDARDLGELLRSTGGELPAAGGRGRVVAPWEPARLLTPAKVVCVGMNYRAHIAELGRDAPTHPTLFAKFPDTLCGPCDDLTLPPESGAVDWEAELTVVIGREARRVPVEAALDHVAGYTVANDVSMRDWQRRTPQWLQGKSFEGTTPVGPVLVTPDEIDHARDLRITTTVDGELVQDSTTADMLFDPATLVAYVSTFTTLRPGDLILTGTPGGVGEARTPPRFLRPGNLVEVAVEGIGSCRNRCVA